MKIKQGLKTKYIDSDDFLAYTGINLNYELKDTDNNSDKANAFLFRIEIRMGAFVDSSFSRQVDNEYKKMSDYQKQNYKYALLEQALYILKNGDISVDSGYNIDSGIVANINELKALAISPNAKNHLILCGLWTRKILPRSNTGIVFNDNFFW